MDDRLHRALDDDRARNALTVAQAAEFHETRALLEGVVRAIPTRSLRPLGASVLRRIDAAERAVTPLRLAAHSHSKRGFGAWLWSPHHVSLSVMPAHALAAAALIVMVALGVTRATGPGAAPVVAASVPADRAPVLVEFRLAAPDAQRVTLAGGFSDWEPTYRMTRATPGVWTVVVPLAPGVHEYAFVVDGQHWVPDPAAPSSPDGFGGVNSRVAVLPADRRS